MSAPRAMTTAEARARFLDVVSASVQYWATLPGMPARERCEGVAFSILVILDGESGGFPGCDVIARPHPDDAAYYSGRGENWIAPGTLLNAEPLHHALHQRHPTRETREVHDV